jgi:hypothetical protein
MPYRRAFVYSSVRGFSAYSYARALCTSSRETISDLYGQTNPSWAPLRSYGCGGITDFRCSICGPRAGTNLFTFVFVCAARGGHADWAAADGAGGAKLWRYFADSSGPLAVPRRLQLEELRILAGLRYQLLMRAGGIHLAILQHENAVGHAHA